MNSPSLHLEISSGSLKALFGESGFEAPIERDASGALSDAARDRVAASLGEFLKRKGWQPDGRALCAVSARGVSMRRLKIPATGKDQLQKLLPLQVESEFPLPPDQLAWGWRSLNGSAAAMDQDVLIVAAKKDVVAGYADMLSRCGVNADFTLAALARANLCPRSAANFALLDIGHSRSELITFENGAPASLRTLPWGSDNLASVSGEAPLSSLAENIKSKWTGSHVFLTGWAARQQDFVSALARRLGDGAQCESLEPLPVEGRSAAILGLKQASETAGGTAPLLLNSGESQGQRMSTAPPAPRKWAALAAGLLVAFALSHFAGAAFLKSRLEKKLVQLKAEEERLPVIDREYSFLQYLKSSQPSYFDTIYLLANNSPGGTRFDTLSMNRGGEITLRGKMAGLTQVNDFRDKLIATGFFATVVVDEVTPGQNPMQPLTMRITAQLKPATAREGLKLPAPASNSPSMGMPGGGPMMPMGGGMPMTITALPGGFDFPAALPPGAVPTQMGGVSPGQLVPSTDGDGQPMAPRRGGARRGGPRRGNPDDSGNPGDIIIQ